MARISETRTQRHKNLDASADMEAPTISESKRIQWPRAEWARMASGATTFRGNSGEAETINRDVAEHGAEVRQNKLGVRKEVPHFVSQTNKEADKQEVKEIKKSKRFATNILSNPPDIEKDQAALQQLQKLKALVKKLGGKLESGWQVTSQRRPNNGSPIFSFISPTEEKFRSRIEVVRHLGLCASVAKNGKSHLETGHARSTDHFALVPYQRRRNKSFIKSAKLRLLKLGKDHVPADKVLHPPNAVTDVHDSQLTSLSDLSAFAITQRCQDILRSIISTQSFAVASNMASWGNPASSMDANLRPSFLASSLDFKLINLRLSTGAYGQSPEMFSTDIQQVWKNIIATGNELVSLASSLSDLSDCLYKQQILSLFEGMPQNVVHPSSTRNRLSTDKTYVILSSSEKVSAKGPDNCPLRGLTTKVSLTDNVGISCMPLARRAMQSGVQRPLSSNKRENTARYELRRKLRKGDGKANELLPSQDGLLCFSSDIARQNHGLNQCEEHFVCNHCKASYTMDSVVPSSVPCGGCCTLCFLMQAAENAYEWETFGNGTSNHETQKDHLFINTNTTDICQDLQKPNAKAGICEACNVEDDNVLLCDACDAAYHMNCLTPPIQSIPDGYWYCPSCEEAGKNIVIVQQDMDFHDCSVCRRVSRELWNCTENESTAQVFSKDTSLACRAPEVSMDYGCRDGSLNQGAPECFFKNKPVARSLLSEGQNVCKFCGVDGGKLLISCSNCQNCYHLSCLKPALRKRPRKTWYCPSCLCRVCKIDVDDDKILLCDACDESFHTYCLTPPLLEIPQEAWFCRSCMEARPIYSELSEKRHEEKSDL